MSDGVDFKAENDGQLLTRLSFRVDELIESGDYEGARRLARKAVQTARRKVEEDESLAPELAQLLEQLANILIYFDEDEEIEVIFGEALDLSQKMGSDADIFRARLYGSLGFAYERMDNFAKAAQAYGQAVGVYDELDTPLPQDLAAMLNNLGFAQKILGDFNAAETAYLRALDIYEHSVGEQSEESATVYNNLGSLYQSGGYNKQAKEMHEEALRIRVELNGVSHPDIAQSYANIASVECATGSLEEAEHNFKKALEIYNDNLATNADEFRIVSENYADLLKLQGKELRAGRALKKAHRVAKRYGLV